VTEAPAASWRSGTVPSTQSSSGEQQQQQQEEETKQDIMTDNIDCAPDAAAEVPVTPLDTAASATTPTSSGRSSCSSSSDDVEVAADNVSPQEPAPATASTGVGKYIIPARRYWLNMGQYWWFSQGRHGNTAAAVVLARLKAGEPIMDSRLAALAAAHTLEELEEMAAVRYYSPACPLGTTTAPEETQQVGGRQGIAGDSWVVVVWVVGTGVTGVCACLGMSGGDYLAHPHTQCAVH